MERLRKHDEFVGVLRLRHRVTSADIVAHYSFARRSSGQQASKEQADSVSCRQDPPSARAIEQRSYCRLGLAVANSVGHAVVRNKIKRRFRVLARRYEDHLPPDCDVILRAKRSAATADFESLDRQVEHLFDEIARKAARFDASQQSGNATDAHRQKSRA